MNKITFTNALILIFLFSLRSEAQIELPYYCGFDNTLQRNGWVEYKTAATMFSNWRYASFGAYSDPTCISHDFSPSTGITLTDNWFVSPPFFIENGGRLDYIWYSFSGFSTPQEGDTIGVYLLSGSQDPEEAVRTLLFDFRGDDYIADNTYRLISDIDLSPSEEVAHLAIRYRNADCSTRWLTVAFDEISVSGGSVGNNEKKLSDIRIFPNPSNGHFTITHSHKVHSLTIFDQSGKQVQQILNATGQTRSEQDLTKFPKGMYTVGIREGNRTYTQKIMLQ